MLCVFVLRNSLTNRERDETFERRNKLADFFLILMLFLGKIMLFNILFNIYIMLFNIHLFLISMFNIYYIFCFRVVNKYIQI